MSLPMGEHSSYGYSCSRSWAALLSLGMMEAVGMWSWGSLGVSQEATLAAGYRGGVGELDQEGGDGIQSRVGVEKEVSGELKKVRDKR